MQAGGDKGARLRDELATHHPLTHLYHGFGWRPKMLAKGQHVAAHEGHPLDRHSLRALLVFFRMNAMTEAAPKQGVQGIHF
jgi:hypothetical protein